VRREAGIAERLLFRAMGAADPAHYLRFEYLRRTLDSWPDVEPREILDAGCGLGDFTFYLAQRYPRARVHGADIDETSIARNREVARELALSNVTFEVADLLTATFGRVFDLVISIDVLQFMVDQKRALHNLARQMVSDGRVFLHVPTVREVPVPLARWISEFRESVGSEGVAKLLTADEVVDLFRSVGFEILASRRTFGYYTGELATSLFGLPYGLPGRKIAQALIAPTARLFALLDPLAIERRRYAVAVTARKR
jgi:trans-aconitate methyltransferase